jgi:hypothetical protein
MSTRKLFGEVGRRMGGKEGGWGNGEWGHSAIILGSLKTLFGPIKKNPNSKSIHFLTLPTASYQQIDLYSQGFFVKSMLKFDSKNLTFGVGGKGGSLYADLKDLI